MSSMTDRLAKLRSLRENLCQKSQTWSEAFETRDWIVENIKDVNINKKPRAKIKPSDHTPIELIIN